MALSSDTKWIIGTLLALIGVVIAAAGVMIAAASGVWGLGRTLATKSDLDGLVTRAEVGELDTRLSESTDALAATVGDLRATVSSLQTSVGSIEATVDDLHATVGSLQTSVGQLRTAVSGVEETNVAVRTLIGVTLPAFFTCMIELDSADNANFPRRDDFTNSVWSDEDLPGICARLKAEVEAVNSSLVPQLPD